MLQIIPTILVKTFKEFQKTVKKIENDFEMAQIDVMDGKFVPNKTFADFKKIQSIKTPLQYELHLMVEEPIEYLYKAKNCKNIKKILFHYETLKNVYRLTWRIKKMDCQVGLVINPDTNIEDIKQYIRFLDCVMIMGVHPGFAGQKFLPDTIDHVKRLRETSKSIEIEVDGGVSDKNARNLADAGADILAVNTYLYSGNPTEQKEKLLKLVKM